MNKRSEGALRESWFIQQQAAECGFDWPDISGVFSKVREEIGEIEEALVSKDAHGAKRELGDLLFAAINLARFLDADPEEELYRANARFTRRFALLQEDLAQAGIAMNCCSLAELDMGWERVKERLRDKETAES